MSVVVPFDPSRFDDSAPGLWRYRHCFDLSIEEPHWRAATLNEGPTALVAAGADLPGLEFKLEYQLPTGSFKARGATVMLAAARQAGARSLVADSSGNAGKAVAVYAALLGMHARVFVPADAAPAKLEAIRSAGAEVVTTKGPRENAAHAAQQAVGGSRAYFASHVLRREFCEGTGTMVYELWEQRDQPPDQLLVPLGNGTMLLGVLKALDALKASGYWLKTPRVVAVQSAACAPLYRAWVEGAESPAPFAPEPTVATGIAIAEPALGQEILARLRGNGGAIVTVDDAAVIEAQQDLLARGHPVEATAAVCYAAWRTCRPSGSTVLPLCGQRD